MGSQTKKRAKLSKSERRRIQRRQALRRQLGWGIAAATAVAVIAVFVFTSSDSTGKGPASSGQVTAGPPRASRLESGDTVPGFSAPALTGGGRVAWSDYRGQPTVLAVWASWCPHCQVELPVLARVAAEFPDVRLTSVVTSIGQNSGPSPEKYMADEGLTFPVAVDDAQNTMGQSLGIQEFPTVYWVGADGRVLQATVGETPEAEMRRLFAQVRATTAA